MKKPISIIIISGIILAISGIVLMTQTQSDTNQTTHKLQVTTSFYPLYFFTTEIAGDSAEVYNITPAGAEPHEYEPTPRDLAHIEDSQLLVLHGVQLEAWGARIKSTISTTDTTVVTVGDTLATIAGDPHIWLDPVLAQQEARAIALALEQADPAHAAIYQANLRSLITKLEQLDRDYVTGLSDCSTNSIITSHAAFGYLAERYRLQQVAIAGLSPEAEPSVQQLADIADFAQQNDAQYIFFESLISPKLAETIATEVGAQTMVLNPLEGLTDEEVASGKTYFTEMETNLKNLRQALSCN